MSGPPDKLNYIQQQINLRCHFLFVFFLLPVFAGCFFVVSFFSFALATGFFFGTSFFGSVGISGFDSFLSISIDEGSATFPFSKFFSPAFIPLMIALIFIAKSPLHNTFIIQ